MFYNVKKGRIWLPDTKGLRGKFLEISIKNRDKETSFFAVISKDGRFYIPKEIRKKLRIKNGVIIESIKLIKNKKRKTRLIKNGKIDLIAIIPKITLSGYEILVIDRNNKYHCWYCTKGRPTEMILSKNVPLLFARLLGYYQAEGGKPKLTERRGRTLSLSNTKIGLIKDFLEISKSLINEGLWKATIRYNKNISLDKIKEIKKILKREGIEGKKITIQKAERIKTFTVTLWISNSLLAEIIDAMNEKIKDFILKKNDEEIFKEYFRGVIAGDGTFYSYRDKKGSLHSWLSIYEEKEKYIRKYKDLLDKYGLEGKIKKIKDKNLYVLTIINNWNALLKLLKYDLFLYAPHHKIKLVWTIKNHKRYKSLKYLPRINEKFDISELVNITNKDYSNCAHWIKKRKKEDLISLINKKGRRSIWQLTTLGQETKEILKNLIESPSNQ